MRLAAQAIPYWQEIWLFRSAWNSVAQVMEACLRATITGTPIVFAFAILVRNPEMQEYIQYTLNAATAKMIVDTILP